MLAGLGIGLCILAVGSRDKREIRISFSVAAAWAASALLSTLFAFRVIEPDALAFFHKFWRAGFMPFPPKSLADVIWPLRIVRGLFWNALNLHVVASAALLLSIWGWISLWRRGRKDAFVLLLLPIVVALFLSLAKAYPFASRLIFFLIPALAIALAEGISSVFALAPRRVQWAAPMAFFVFLFPQAASLVASPPPWPDGELKPALRYIARNRQPGDGLLVNAFAVPALKYYGPGYGVAEPEWIGLTADFKWNPGADTTDDNARISSWTRIWLVLAQQEDSTELMKVKYKLDSTALRISSRIFRESRESPGAKTFLYDLRAAPLRPR
jgi:hypothetical protein